MLKIAFNLTVACNNLRAMAIVWPVTGRMQNIVIAFLMSA